jgi:hypothetical protein
MGVPRISKDADRRLETGEEAGEVGSGSWAMGYGLWLLAFWVIGIDRLPHRDSSCRSSTGEESERMIAAE